MRRGGNGFRRGAALGWNMSFVGGKRCSKESFGVGSEGEGVFIERNDVDAVVELLDEASEGEARGRRGGGEGHGVDGSCAAKFSMEEPVSAGSPSLKQPGGGGGLLMESLLGMPMAVRQRVV